MSLEYLSVKNAYDDNDNRNSFSLEIYKCSAMNPNCRSDAEISKMLKHLMFNTYTLKEKAKYNPPLGESPLFGVDEFHSQFMLSLDSYRDNNNFLIHSHYKT
jgi:hypothetical protein